MIATVRPASASDSIGWRPAKAIRVSRFTARVLHADGTGRRLSHMPRAAPPLVPVPEVRQPGDLPPAPRLRVPAPQLAPAHGALGLGVAVDRADLDLARDGAVGQHRAGALAVAGHLQLAVALQFQPADRVG